METSTEIQNLSVKNDPSQQDPNSGGAGFALLTLVGGKKKIADHWTPKRDKDLFNFFLQSDYLKVAVQTFISKAIAVPLRFVPDNLSDEELLDISDELYTRLITNSELLRGFTTALKKFILDYLTQDNGAFMYIYADGLKTQPIVGMPYGVEHLPSSRCVRTGNPEYPVRYTHTDGKSYIIHFTRLIEMVNMPSPDPKLKGVGLCPISLCLDASRELLDMVIYSQEKFGSRPQRRILYAKTGATIDQLTTALNDMNIKLDSEGLTMFAKTGVFAPKLPGGKLELETVDLVSAPEGFDRDKLVLMDLAVIATSFGLDLRDLAHSFGIEGQTKSDASALHQKGLGKGVSEFLNNLAVELSNKFAPEKIFARFDYIDDQQDQAQAEIRSSRTQSRTRDIMAGVATIRSTRIQMLADSEITEDQFNELELEDGRLPDGTDLNRLIHTSDVYQKRFLNFTVDFPEDVMLNDPTGVIDEINENLVLAYEELESLRRSPTKLRKLRQVLALLTRLKKAYVEEQRNLTMQQTMLDNSTKMISGESKPNNALSPQERMNNVAGKVTKNGLIQTNKKGGQNGNSAPFPSLQREKYLADFELPDYDVTVDDSFIQDSLKYIGFFDSDRFKWYPKKKLFFDTDTNKWLTAKKVREILESLAEEVFNNATSSIDEHTVESTYKSFWPILISIMLDAYLLGIGGTENFDTDAKTFFDSLVMNQKGYYQNFGSSILGGNLTLAQIADRFRLYTQSIRKTYEQGRLWAYGKGQLQFPGGVLPGYGTACGTNCKCHIQIIEKLDRWEISWIRTAKESCEDCVRYASQWNPYIVYK